MADDRLFLDPAVDFDARDGRVRYLTPKGAFAVRDIAGIAADISQKCQDGAPAEHLINAYSSSEHREAAGELIQFLQNRKVLTSRSAKISDIDPARPWISHYACAPDIDLPFLALQGSGKLAQALSRRLSSVGARFADDGACIIAAFDAPDLAGLRDLNRRARDGQLPFFPVWLERSRVRWGPMVLPHATGCLECLLHREHTNRRRVDPIETMSLPQLSVSDMLSELGAVLATGEILRWALDAHVETDVGVAWHFDWLTMEMEGAKVLRLPRCPVCGTTEIGQS